MEQIQNIIQQVKQRDPDQVEFIQAIDEVLGSLSEVITQDASLLNSLKLMVEPERAIQFRVPWLDDSGKIQMNRGFRFLGFEQTLKNALTGLPMGGGKGGSDFNPRGKSDNEVMKFCQSFMTELCRHIGARTDVPAGDIGVGAREIGYLFGQYKRIKNEFTGVLTGKHVYWGGSHLRPEATGYGIVYFFNEILKHKNLTMKGQTILISGSGNVAQFCVEKLLELGAIPLTMSDSSGFIFEESGITKEGLQFIKHLKNHKRGRIHQYLEFSKTAKFYKGGKPWGTKADYAIPCATQNEITVTDVQNMINNKLKGVIEGANMPSTTQALQLIQKSDLIFAPSKAANAGGVAVSGLEMSQDHIGTSWTPNQVDTKLKEIMSNIFKNCSQAAKKLGKEGNLLVGANVAGFLKVAKSMKHQGCV